MKKKVWIPIAVVLGLIFIPSGIVLAVSGIDGFAAYQEALEYGLKGLVKFFEFIIELFKTALA